MVRAAVNSIRVLFLHRDAIILHFQRPLQPSKLLCLVLRPFSLRALTVSHGSELRKLLAN
jgi:hypothetical protein